MIDDLQRRADEAEEAGNLELALELWKERSHGDDAAIFLLKYGRLAFKMGRWEEAESAFSDAIRLCPPRANSLFRSLSRTLMGTLWLKRTDMDHTGSLTTAKEWFIESLAVERKAPTLSLLGAACARLDDTDGARAAFEEAIALDPEYEEAFFNLALIEEESNLQKARELLERAIQLDPNRGAAHGVLGRVCQKMKEPALAEQHYRRALEVDPTDYWATLYLANLLGTLKRNQEAEQVYKSAIQLRPDLAGSYEFFARFLVSIGKIAEATEVRALIPPTERAEAAKL
jgi:tetratricopeptide (TPR) repeat protein